MEALRHLRVRFDDGVLILAFVDSRRLRFNLSRLINTFKFDSDLFHPPVIYKKIQVEVQYQLRVNEFTITHSLCP